MSENIDDLSNRKKGYDHYLTPEEVFELEGANARLQLDIDTLKTACVLYQSKERDLYKKIEKLENHDTDGRELLKMLQPCINAHGLLSVPFELTATLLTHLQGYDFE